MKTTTLIILILLVCSCKNNSDGIADRLQSNPWRVTGWLGQGQMTFSQSSDNYDWQAGFRKGKLSKTLLFKSTESVFDAHGNEIAPGSIYTDSCYTYELKKDIIKISSQGHAPPEEIYYFKIIPQTDNKDFQLTPESETNFK